MIDLRKLQKEIEDDLITPLKDKERTMKLNYLLSNKYVLLVLIGGVDIVFLLLGSYLLNVLGNIPAFLLSGSRDYNTYLGLRNILPFTLSFGQFLFLILALSIVDVVLIYKIRTSFSEKNFNIGQKGKQRFATEDEIKEQYLEIEPLHIRYPGNPGVLISRIKDKFYIDTSPVNNLYIGITRSGKGEIGAKPNIEIYSRAEFQPSMLINDPKIEHYKTFKKVLEKRGYLVYLLNCSNPRWSMGYNPLELVIEYYKKKEYDTAEMVINSFTHMYFDVDGAAGDMKYFASAASDLCAAMILATLTDAFKADELYNQERYEKWSRLSIKWKYENPFEYEPKNEKTINFYSMIVVFGKLVHKKINKTGTRTMVDKFFESRPDTDRAKLKYLSTEVAPDKTKSGVFSEMLKELTIFTLPGVAKMTSESSINLKDIGFGEKPIAVFMATPSYDSSLNRIPALFLRQVYYAIAKECDDHKGKCDRQIRCVLEEAGNMFKIDHLVTMTTMGLGQNWYMDIFLHDYEQLSDKYGEKEASTIKGNCSNHIYILTKSETTAEEFSNLLGNKSYIDVQRGGEKLSINKHYTETIQEMPLLDKNRLLQLMEEECVIHRSIKRRDNSWEKIIPYPIFNSVENERFLWFAHTYFTEEFPNPNEVNLYDICTESREHIQMEERIWNPDISFKMLNQENIQVRCLKEVNYGMIKEVLENMFDKNYCAEHGITPNTSVAEFTDFINKQEELSLTEKRMILAIVEEGAA